MIKVAEAPRYSVVVTARNDNHGGDLLRRMQIFVSGLQQQCRRHGLHAELVVVEWNPPGDRPPLAEALDWAGSDGLCEVRVIEVPPRVHHLLDHSDGLPLFQMIGKNVGIRRARGQFVLATNVDILFSHELMSFLASTRLREDSVYRVDRYDVAASIQAGTSLDEQLSFCRSNVLRVARRWGTVDPEARDRVRPVWKPRWAASVYDILQECGLLPIARRSRVHENACGDFTLMARDKWVEVRAYPEFQSYSMFIDGLLLHAAYHSGVREVFLPDPMRIYHLEHGAGSGWTPEGQEKLYARLRDSGVPQLDYTQYIAWCVQMRRERRPLIFNDEAWGLRDHRLKETRPLERVTGSGSSPESTGQNPSDDR